jgi:hypothetical protein
MSNNYEEMIARYKELYNLDDTTLSDWQKTLAVIDGRPAEAYRQFGTVSDASILLQGQEIEGETYYDVYAGALISVIADTPDNNGLYQVVNNPEYDESSDNRKFLLKKYYDASTVESLIGNVGMYFKNVEDPDADKQMLVYFTGVSDPRTHKDSSMFIVPSIAYDKDGTLFAETLVQTSDARLKDHIEELDVDLGKVGEIDKVKYTWKDNMNGKRHIGTTAQSLEATFPELVYTNPETGYKAVNYEGLSVIALAAIDKLYARVRELENIVRKLTKEQQ